MTQSQQKGKIDFKQEFAQRYSFLHDLYVLCDNDIRQIDIWMERPAMEFLNMLVYMIDYNKLQEASMD